MSSPIIESYEFGRLIIDGKIYKDVVISDGNVTEWKWKEHHAFTMDDVKPLLDGVDVLILGTGASGFVEVKPDVITFFETNNIKYIVAKSAKACERYNELVKAGKKVAAIIHATC